MEETRPLFIPVILGTTRQGRMTETVARFVYGELSKRKGVVSELIDIRDLEFPTSDAGEAVKNAKLSETVARADAHVLVVQE